MSRKLCAICGELLKVKKNGVKVRYGKYLGFFMADLWECPVCGYQFLELADREIFKPDAEVDYDFSDYRKEKEEVVPAIA